MNRNVLKWHLVEGPITFVFTLHLEVSWDGLWTLYLGSHNIMVTALSSCVNGPQCGFFKSKKDLTIYNKMFQCHPTKKLLPDVVTKTNFFCYSQKNKKNKK